VPDDVGPRGFDDYELRLGDIMRGERATLGKSLLDVQRELKIKASYIAAIENADPTAFETPGFIAGYVRSYARYLGLDPEWAYSAFRREGGMPTPPDSFGQTGEKGEKKDKSKASPQKPRNDPFGDPRAPYIPSDRPLFTGVEPRAVASIAILCALIGVIGYGGWAVLKEVQKVRFVPVDQAPEIIAELDPLNRTVAPATDEPSGEFVATGPTADALDRLYRPKALDVPVMVARDGPIAALDPASVGALAPVQGGERLASSRLSATPGSDVPTSLDAALAEALDDTTTPVLTEQVETPELALVAVRPSWVRVRAADGTVIFEKILDANEKYVLPETEGVPTLRAGNAGSLYFAVNGQAYGPAGQGPSVVKNVQLSADALTAAYALADMEADTDLARYYAEAEVEPEVQAELPAE
jgi:cytoskeletal protein RodZ